MPGRVARLRHVMVGLLATAILLPSVAPAQNVRSFRRSPEITEADIEIIRKLAREGLTGKPTGTTLDWSNPQSGNSGTVTLLQAFPSAGRACRKIRYFITPEKPNAANGPATYDITSCLGPEGRWRIDSGARPDAAKP